MLFELACREPDQTELSKTIYRAGVRFALAGLIFATFSGAAWAGEEFTTCSDDALPGLSGSLCAVSSAPLRSNDPEAGVVELFIRKFPSASGAATGQVWLIAGGPGESGASFYPFLNTMRAAFPDRDLIIPDHRGTGYSTRLCPAEETADSEGGYALSGAEWGSCIGGMYADIERTQAFTITNASHDLSQLVTRYRSEGAVQVYGVSYGTQLILRMLQTAPVSLDGVVLDGLVPSEASSEWDLSHRTAVVDKVGKSLLTADERHAYAALLTDPARQALWADIAPNGDLRRFLATLLNFPGLRDQIPSVISGLIAGDASKLAAVRASLATEFEQLSQYPQSAPALPLVILMNASENNGRRDLTSNDVELEARNALFTSSLPGLLVGSSAPLYDRDAFYGRSPAALPRTLVIHGTLDPNTPYEGAVAHAAELSGVGKVTFSTVVNGAHMLPFAAPECFVRIVSAFDAAREVPESCASVAQTSH